MRLAIADPPYLGRAARNYGPGSDATAFGQGKTFHQTMTHPDAYLWDDPATHEGLVRHLVAEFDGWAVALTPDALRHYLQWVPEDTRVCSWHRPRSVPTGARVTPSWEPVLVFIPPARRGRRSGPHCVDTLTAPPPQTFVGAKPSSWTRWVLDLLAYDPEVDTISDLFPGSRAVSSEIAQGVLL